MDLDTTEILASVQQIDDVYRDEAKRRESVKSVARYQEADRLQEKAYAFKDAIKRKATIQAHSDARDKAKADAATRAKVISETKAQRKALAQI